jgi:hypothetical protein
MSNKNEIFMVNRISAIFIFTLIISGNFLAHLFPCRVQKLLTENMVFKHLFGFLILFSFGVRMMPESYNLMGLFDSAILYAVFVITAKTNYKIWICLFFIYMTIYLLHVAITDYEAAQKQHKVVSKSAQSHIEKMKTAQQWGIVAIPCLTAFGLIVYLGEKKTKYGKKFNYLDFIMGKPSCASDIVHSRSMMYYARAAFN